MNIHHLFSKSANSVNLLNARSNHEYRLQNYQDGLTNQISVAKSSANGLVGTGIKS